MKSEVLSFFFFVMTQEMKPVRVISFSGGIFPKMYPLPVDGGYFPGVPDEGGVGPVFESGPVECMGESSLFQ